VQSALAHGLELPGGRGKQTAPDHHREQQILDWIQQNAEQSIPVSKTEIKDHSRLGELVFSSSSRQNHQNEKCLSRTAAFASTPMFLERTVHDLNEQVQGCVAELVFDLDEVGISDWENRKTKRVIVPATMVGQTIHHEISRTVKYISVIACVSTAGESLSPYIITSQASRPVREQLKKHGVRYGTDFVLRLNPKPDSNAESLGE
jgi:hypothetical protein